MSESQVNPVSGLYEIVYTHGPDGRPVESSRERVNDDCWAMRDGRLLLAPPGPGPAQDFTEMLTGEYPKFVVVP